jgi:6-phosphogluconolactonase
MRDHLLPLSFMLLAACSRAHASRPATHYVYVSGYDSTISILTLDLATGGLAKAGTATSGKAPSYLSVAPSRSYLYAVDETDQDAIAAFKIDSASGRLREINRVSGAGAGAAHIAVDPTGRWLVTAHYDSSSVTVHAIRGDGGIGEKIDDQAPGKFAHQAVFDASGRFVFVPCLGSNLVAQYQLRAGKLVPNTPATIAVGGGPRHMAFDAAEKHAYVLSELDNTVTSFDYDSASGRLSRPETVSTVAAGGKKTEAGHIVVHRGGRFLYASNRVDNSLAIFAIDPHTGRLTIKGWQRSSVDYVRDFAIDPTGRFLLAANQNAGKLAVFRIDEKTGELTPVGGPLAVPANPAFVAIVPLP